MRCHACDGRTHEHTDSRKVGQYSVWTESAIRIQVIQIPQEILWDLSETDLFTLLHRLHPVWVPAVLYLHSAPLSWQMSIPGPPNAIQDLIDVKQSLARWSKHDIYDKVTQFTRPKRDYWHWARWHKVRGGKGASSIAEDLIESEDPNLHLSRFTGFFILWW